MAETRAAASTDDSSTLTGEALAAPASGPRWAVVGIFLILLVAGFAYARAFLIPTVLAFLLTLVFAPVRRALDRFGLPSVAAAVIITGVLLGLVVAVFLALATPVTNWMQDAQAIGQQIEWKLRDLRGIAAQVQDAAKQLDEIAEAAPAEEVQRVVIEQPGMAWNLAGTAPAAASQVLFTLVLMFFLLASGDMFYEKIVHVMPTFRDKRRAITIAHDIERTMSRYLFTITAINAGLGLAVGAAMWALGMPSPLLFGVAAFLLNFIPYLGAIVGVVLAGLVGLISLSTPWDAAVVAAVYLGLTSFEGQFVTPYFVGRSLQLNTVVIFLSVTFWAWMWSVVGMLVATPLLVAVRVFCDHIPALYNFGSFLSARGAERAGSDDAD